MGSSQWSMVKRPILQQRTLVQSLVRDDSHAAEQLGPRAATTEACSPRTFFCFPCAMRSHANEKSTPDIKEYSWQPQLEKAHGMCSNKDSPQQKK